MLDGPVDGYLQERLGIAYPLMESPSGLLEFNSVIADMEIVLPPGTTPSPQINMASLQRLGAPGSVPSPYALVLTDANANTIFDSTTAINTAVGAWGEWCSVEWQQNGNVVRILINDANMQEIFSSSSLNVNTELVPHVITCPPPIVTAFETIVGSTSVNMTAATTFVGAHNTELQVGQTAAGDALITINMTPGLGSGTYMDCQTTAPFITSINAVSPNSAGEFWLTPQGCYWGSIPPSAESYSSSSLNAETLPLSEYQLHNNCQTCLSCEDVIAEYTKLVTIYNRAAALFERLLAVVYGYESAALTMENIQSARKVNDLALTVQVYPKFGWTCGVYVGLKSGTLGIASGTLTVTASPTGLVHIPNSFYGKVPRETTAADPFNGAQIVIAHEITPRSIDQWMWELSIPSTTPVGTTLSVSVNGTLTMQDGSIVNVSTVTSSAPHIGAINKT